MYNKLQWLEVARSLQSIAQAGLTYTQDMYDRERFEQIMQISKEIVGKFSELKMSKIHELYNLEHGYLTPKVDVRGVVFQEDKILMVREKIDGRWSLPGGWADVGLTASEVVEKEVWEEAGIKVKATRLLAVFDKKCHAHPPELYYVYKMFFLCEKQSGEIKTGLETSDVQYFTREALPELSVNRNTADQIQTMFRLKDEPADTLFD